MIRHIKEIAGSGAAIRIRERTQACSSRLRNMASHVFPLLAFASLFLAAAVLAAPVEEEGEVEERTSFAGFRVLSLTPRSDENVKLLRHMEEAPDTDGIDFWASAVAPNVPVTISVRPDLVRRMLQL